MNETKPPLTDRDIFGPGVHMSREGEIIYALREKLATMTRMYDEMKNAKFSESKRANALEALVTSRPEAQPSKDALRYQWWTKNYGAEYDGMTGRLKLYTLVRELPRAATKEQFDEAIDEAILQSYAA